MEESREASQPAPLPDVGGRLLRIDAIEGSNAMDCRPRSLRSYQYGSGRECRLFLGVIDQHT